ncbi:hypothetical protein M422DRAFT_56470 [Sphaerobolus stellatus SS14]|uniref:Unplaced genomic scaffold SPHSTscaffold_437, whole genome shotgun sequence n=1 Tax=Sphaerobolus stellatus (strain SS14) TaxID=990650 RepID=A0A0C9UGA2_SPHS4|nr:hypothetical protein M422DRAFT_56470 [Sphaerobolus stellatus SS14]
MQFTTIFTVLAAFAPQLLRYDPVYDNANGDLHTVACSDGPNGLLTKGFTTFGSLPNFAYIGGAPAVEGWNSASCGTCWTLTFNGKTINVLAIYHSAPGFNIALSSLNELNKRSHLGGLIFIQISSNTTDYVRTHGFMY